jgi:arginyl-tRNA synthetase
MRKGTAIFLDEVLDEALIRAQAVIDEKMAEGKTDLSPDEKESASQAIGIGAIIYNDLYQDPGRGIRFDWDKMLSFDGNSAPYIQYTYARCRSILRKAGELPQEADYGVLSAPEEQAVIKQLGKFPQTVRRAGQELLPALVADWTYALAREFARFYHEHPVLEAPTPELRSARLGLVAAVATGLRNGLALLGIKAPERM